MVSGITEDALILRKGKILDGHLGGKLYSDCRLLGQSYGPPTITAPSLRDLCMEATWVPYDFRVETAWQVHRHFTISGLC